MSQERFEKAFDYWRQSTEKFDYFVLGLTGALCAYISQTYTPTILGLNPGTLELIALCMFVAAVVAGFKRIEGTISNLRYAQLLIGAQNDKNGLIQNLNAVSIINEATGEIYSREEAELMIKDLTEKIPLYKDEIKNTNTSMLLAYHLRNLFIFFGLIILVISKVWSAYV